MLHALLTTLHVVSLILQRFEQQPESVMQLLAGSGIAPSDLSNPGTRITQVQELQVYTNVLVLRADLGLLLINLAISISSCRCQRSPAWRHRKTIHAQQQAWSRFPCVPTTATTITCTTASAN